MASPALPREPSSDNYLDPHRDAPQRGRGNCINLPIRIGRERKGIGFQCTCEVAGRGASMSEEPVAIQVVAQMRDQLCGAGIWDDADTQHPHDGLLRAIRGAGAQRPFFAGGKWRPGNL